MRAHLPLVHERRMTKHVVARTKRAIIQVLSDVALTKKDLKNEVVFFVRRTSKGLLFLSWLKRGRLKT